MPTDITGINVLLQQQGSNVSYSTNGGQNYTPIGSWPVTIKTASANVQFTTDLEFTSTTQYFIMGANSITVDGSNHVVNVNVASYPGLVQNGFSNITIQNIGVKSTYSVAQYGGWIGQQSFGNNATNNLVTNCYSTGDINDFAGGIFGSSSSSQATNCYSIGTIGLFAGGIFGKASQGSATNCYSTGDISGNNAGGIFGFSSSGSATNCYSMGNMDGTDAGGIFGAGSSSQAIATNCYSTCTTIGTRAGGIFGSQSQGSATNCYSTGTLGDSAGGIFGASSLLQAIATNCYSRGTIRVRAGGIFGYQSSGSATNCYSIGNYSTDNGEGIGGGSQTNCYSTDGDANWLDASANAALDVSGNAWTDIDLSSNTVPYLLSAFTGTLYDPSYNTNANNSGQSVLTDCSYSIVSINDANPSLYSGITINRTTGEISFRSISNATYEVNVLAMNANNGYSFGTFTNTISNVIDASGTVLLQQVGSDVQYSTDGTNWSTAVWPVILNNTDSNTSILEVKFTTDLSLNSASQYFIMGSLFITVDGSNHVVNINLSGAGYPGLFKNGSYYYDASGNIAYSNITNTDITIKNIIIDSHSSSLLAIAPSTTVRPDQNKIGNGWLCQAYFGLLGVGNSIINCSSNGGTDTVYWVNSTGNVLTNNTGITQGGCIVGDLCSVDVTDCYSSGTIGSGAGGIIGQNNFESIATKCYSTGNINGSQAGGIFAKSTNCSAFGCYSTGDISGNNAGGIFGYDSSSNIAEKCYSTGNISGNNAGGIFAKSTNCSALDCYSIGDIIGNEAGGIFGSSTSGIATNCYSTGNINGTGSGGIFQASNSGTSRAVNCYSIGTINADASGIGGHDISYCYYTDGSTNWLDASANAALDVSGTNVWTDIDLNSNKVPYLLSAFSETLYNPDTATSATTSGASVLTDCSFSIVSVNSENPSDYSNITIDANTGNISFDSLQYGTSFEVNVLATNSNDGYAFGTFTNNVDKIDSSGTILLKQNGTNVQYSINSGVSWTTISTWPVTLNNSDTSSTLTVTFTTDISLNSTTKYFVIGSDHITVDGSNNVVTITLDSYPGLLQNGSADASGNSYITIQNLGVKSTYNLAENGGWIGQQYFGKGATDNSVTNCYSTGNISTGGGAAGHAGGIFGQYGSGSATNCYSTGTIGQRGGGIFGEYGSGSATNCYSIGTIGPQAGGIFGQNSSGSASNCYSTGPTIGINAGGIFGYSSLGLATDCYSTGTIASSAGGILGGTSSGSAINCYSIGDININAGGIFGSISRGSATNCYSTGDISGNAGGIFGRSSQSQAIATNCYSTGTIGSNAGGIFGLDGSGSAYNCYSTGRIDSSGSGIGGNGTKTYCYYTDGSANWLDASANVALDFSGNPWTDIDLNSQTVPYLLSAFTSTLYSPSSATDAATSGASIVTDSSFSIVSVNDANPSLYSGIIINSNTGDISFNSVSYGTTYVVNVLATNTKDGYSFGTFTNSVTTIDASGTVLLQQVGSEVQYSTDNGQTWAPVTTWPVTLNNSGSFAPGVRAGGTPLIITFTDDLSFNLATQYFVLGTDDIIVDGSNHIVTIDVPTNDYPGVFQNGDAHANGNSYITIQNLGVESIYSVASGGGWIGQQFFGNNATDNSIISCYSTGNMDLGGGGIVGGTSNVEVSKCYSIGNMTGQYAGGIFGQNSDASSSAINCYSTGTIGGDYAGGIFGQNSQGSATNCYSIGDISGNSAGGIFSNGAVLGNLIANNCYSSGIISGTGADGIGNAILTNCYATDGSANWLDASANAALDVSGNYTDIDTNSENVPYRLTSFLNQQILYDPSGGTNVPSPESPDISGNYTWSITSVNGSTTNTSGITIDSTNGDISFGVSSNGTYATNVLAVDRFGNYSYETFTNIISNICFPAGTPIVTNQGIIAINKINPAIHTIRNKKIVAITKTVSPDKYLVKFEKNALGPNLPCEATTMTQNHMLFYKGQMIKAKEFLKTHQESVSKVPYNGQVLYNVLMEEHDKMVVNNLICETLHPENYVAKMHQVFKMLTPKQRVELIQKVNKEIIERDIFSTFEKGGAKPFGKGGAKNGSKNENKVRIQLTL